MFRMWGLKQFRMYMYNFLVYVCKGKGWLRKFQTFFVSFFLALLLNVWVLIFCFTVDCVFCSAFFVLEKQRSLLDSCANRT